ncbi:hypothetical protein [uncultured Microscilla sp.]|uniref:hypothetical protein n=1 Tax=uncultured Microscilla sp. TaxID=432653 RepID=UPI0026302913|nr:hypothetical protein [uncultured Microscilla sp.]
MLKKLKQYIQWLFQGNLLKYHSGVANQQVTFKGKSRAFQRLMLNSTLSLAAMSLPIVPMVVLENRHPLLVITAIILLLAGFVAFCLGVITMAYQPFWLHKNQLTFTPNYLQMVNSVGIKQTIDAHKLKAFTLRYDFSQAGVVQIQLWINHRKAYFVNAYLSHFATNAHDLFEQLKPYFVAWGFSHIDIPAQSSTQSGSWFFQRVGKTAFVPNLSLTALQQASKEHQLNIGDAPEVVVKYLVEQQGETLQVSRPKNYTKKMWWGFWLSLVIGVAIIYGLVYMLVYHPGKNDGGIYVFLGCIGLLWIIFVALFYSNATEAFCLRISPEEFYIKKRKKEQRYPLHQIQGLALQGIISQGRYTTVMGRLSLVVNHESVPKPIILLIVDSGRSEKLDTPLVRDSTYQRSMRLARLIAQPMGLEIDWKGFKEGFAAIES